MENAFQRNLQWYGWTVSEERELKRRVKDLLHRNQKITLWKLFLGPEDSGKSIFSKSLLDLAKFFLVNNIDETNIIEKLCTSKMPESELDLMTNSLKNEITTVPLEMNKNKDSVLFRNRIRKRLRLNYSQSIVLCEQLNSRLNLFVRKLVKSVFSFATEREKNCNRFSKSNRYTWVREGDVLNAIASLQKNGELSVQAMRQLHKRKLIHLNDQNISEDDEQSHSESDEEISKRSNRLWSPEEIQQLKEFVSQYGENWDLVLSKTKIERSRRGIHKKWLALKKSKRMEECSNVENISTS